MVVTEAVLESGNLRDCLEKRFPVVFRHGVINVGDCVRKWKSPGYLEEKIGDKLVSIHVTADPLMNFVEKNFVYRSLPVSQLISRCQTGSHQDHFVSQKEKYYLRSLAFKNQKTERANVEKDFPEIFGDINIPSVIPREKLFSSVLRISSPGVQIWTHYDVMDNILIQVVGSKRVTLFKPQDYLNLYMNGDKSQVINIDDPDLQRFPLFGQVTHYTTVLHPGDAIFIPAMWFHNCLSLDYSVGLNVFWRQLEAIFYDPKDIYGNRDLVPASRAVQSFEKTLRILNELPADYQDFYGRKLIEVLRGKLLSE